MYLRLIILAIITFTSIYNPTGAQTLDYFSKDSSKVFFPVKYFIDTINTYCMGKDEGFYERRLNSSWYETAMYSEPLIKLKEPKIFSHCRNETYRFTWFGHNGRSHNPFSIRIEKIDSGCLIVVKYQKCKYIRGEIRCELKGDTMFKDDQVWTELKNKIDRINFWQISPVEKTDIVSMDGSNWIFEGNKIGIYHMVHRKNGKNKDIGELGIYLVKLINLKLKKREFY